MIMLSKLRPNAYCSEPALLLRQCEPGPVGSRRYVTGGCVLHAVGASSCACKSHRMSRHPSGMPRGKDLSTQKRSKRLATKFARLASSVPGWAWPRPSIPNCLVFGPRNFAVRMLRSSQRSFRLSSVVCSRNRAGCWPKTVQAALSGADSNYTMRSSTWMWRNTAENRNILVSGSLRSLGRSLRLGRTICVRGTAD